MSDGSAIEWTDFTWPVVTGCTKISDGCIHCYIERTIPFRMAKRRFDRPGIGGKTDVIFNDKALRAPLAMKKGRRIFISMGDPFHHALTDEQIAAIFAVAAMTPQHTYQFLTKRPARMRALLTSDHFWRLVGEFGRGIAVERVAGRHPSAGPMKLTPDSSAWGHWQAAAPLPNVWLGVSVEDQKTADLRIPILLDTPGAVRWLSMEPLLGPVDLPQFVVAGADDCPCDDGGECLPNIDWVVVGGESGPGARPMHPDWARSLRDQCVQGGIRFFFKQWGEHLPVKVYDHPGFVGGRCYNRPGGGTAALAIRERGPSGTFRNGVLRPMRVGETCRSGTLLDERTFAARIGKKAAGRELDGREWNEYPEGANRV